MKGTLLIPYLEQKDNFEVENISPEDYVKMLEDEFRQTSVLLKNSDIGSGQVRYNPNAVTSNYKEDNFNFYELPVVIKDMNDLPENINSLIRYYQTGEMIIMILEFGDENEDALGELNFWINNSSRINNDPDINPDSKLGLLPEQTFKLRLNNGSMVKLDNCRLVETISSVKIAMLVQKIIFLKN